MNEKQLETKTKIETMAQLFCVDIEWAIAIAMVESSLGLNQKSPTGAKGVFQMTQVAMKDLWLLMGEVDDDLVDISCGILFLRLLKKRWGSLEEATKHYCDPADIDFYVPKVMKERKRLKGITD